MAGRDRDDRTDLRGPRSGTVETVLTTAFRLLIQEGAHAITPQRIHAETGVARTTVYRNWPTTADLITTMLAKATSEADLPAFTGDYRADLDIGVQSLVFRFNNRPLRPLFGALVEHGRQGGEADLAAGYIRALLRPLVRAIEQAIERGDRPPGDPEVLAVELAGPLLTRHILLGETVSEADGRQAVTRFVSG